MDLRYPIGQFQYEGPLSNDQRRDFIDAIDRTPTLLREAVTGLSDEQLETPYRPEGWTVRQVVHHVPDSHINAYVRFRLALTEDKPSIKPYMEAQWAELPDARTAPIEPSLVLLHTLHERWVLLLRSMTADQFQRAFQHPEWGEVTLAMNLALYAWHGRHHVAQITALRERMGW